MAADFCYDRLRNPITDLQVRSGATDQSLDSCKATLDVLREANCTKLAYVCLIWLGLSKMQLASTSRQPPSVEL